MTSAALTPPAIPWVTIQSQPMSPMARSRVRSQAGGRLPSPTTGGSARTSEMRMNANDRPTAIAAPAR